MPSIQQPSHALEQEGAVAAPKLTAVAGGGTATPRLVTLDRVVFWLFLAAPVAVTVRYIGYYMLDRGGRVRDPLHYLLDPGRPVGLAFGLVGLALFVFMWLYPMRKRVKALRALGRLGTWLHVHVLAGIVLPLLVAVHAAWRFNGLIGLGYAAMMLVILSGVVGRYLYARIPRHRNGIELSRDEVSNERRALLTRIAAEAGLDPNEVERALSLGPLRSTKPGPIQALALMVADDFARRRALRDIRRRWAAPRPGAPAPDPEKLRGILKLAQRQIALEQQVRMLEATHRIFGWWHVAHLPVAVTAVLAVMIHVVVAILIGGVRLR